MDDDALDPSIAERFRALDDVVVPDTWPADTTQPTRPRRWPVLAAAAAGLLIIGSIVVLSTRTDDEGSIVGAPATSQPVTTATAPSTTFASVPPTVYVVENALAIAEPAIVRPGESVAITPAGVVEQYCDKVNVFGPATGTIMGGQWSLVDPVTATYSCDGPVTDTAVEVTVPDVPAGDYRFCVAEFDVAEGCALVRVVESGGEVDVQGLASPSTVVPGQVVTITPTEPVRRACTDLVAVYTGGTYVGHVGGSRFSPSPGEGDTVPACEGDVSGDPIEVFAPNLPVGRYVFCVSDDLLAEGCAHVDVLPSPLLATVTSTGVANGDTITITPAGQVPRICTDIVLVYDVTRTEPVANVYDIGTGASEPPRDGGWPFPACGVAPSAAPLTMVVPGVGTGAYAFCLSAGLEHESCALVYVTEKRLDPPPVSTVAADPGQAFEVAVGTHCGVRYLSQVIDGRSWITDEADVAGDWLPDEWARARDGELLVLQVVLSEDGMALTATANDRSVRYRPVNADDPEFFCA